jgi:hypothetical protein
MQNQADDGSNDFMSADFNEESLGRIPVQGLLTNRIVDNNNGQIFFGNWNIYLVYRHIYVYQHVGDGYACRCRTVR